jgi:hypothetical protein
MTVAKLYEDYAGVLSKAAHDPLVQLYEAYFPRQERTRMTQVRTVRMLLMCLL